jgi:hypothetical protein
MKDHFTSPAEQLDFIHCIMEDSRQGLEEMEFLTLFGERWRYWDIGKLWA